jgi:hypothetical protein
VEKQDFSDETIKEERMVKCRLFKERRQLPSHFSILSLTLFQILLSIKGFNMFTAQHIVNNLKLGERTVKLYKSLSMRQDSSAVQRKFTLHETDCFIRRPYGSEKNLA